MDPYRDRLKVTNGEYSLNVLESKAKSLGLTVSNKNEENYRTAILAWMDENNYGETPRVTKSPPRVTKSPRRVSDSPPRVSKSRRRFSKSPVRVSKSRSETLKTNPDPFENMPIEILLEIAKNIPDEDILNLCQTNLSFYNLCNDVSFWSRRALAKGYISKLEEFETENKYKIKTPQERYLQLLSIEDCVPGSEKYVEDWKEECSYRAGKKGNIEIINYFLKKGGDINTILYGAAEEGHLDPIKYLIEKGANKFNWALRGAAKGGDIDLLKYLIEKKGATDFHIALVQAAQGGHLEIVKYFIEEKKIRGKFHSLIVAVSAGYLDIVKYLLEKEKEDKIIINKVLETAVIGGHIDVVAYLIDEEGGNYYMAFHNAVREGNVEMVKYLIEAYNISNGLDLELEHAARRGYIDIVKYLIDEKEVHVNYALRGAAQGGHIDLVKYLIEEKRANDFNGALKNAASFGSNIEIAKYLISKGANSFNLSIQNAKLHRYSELAKYLESEYKLWKERNL